MAAPVRTSKLALLTNAIAPARVPLYQGLASSFDLVLLHGGTESNRDFWHDLDNKLPNATVKRAWGWKIRTAKTENGEIVDYRYFHLTPGYIWDLLRLRPEIVITNEMGFRTLISLLYGSLFRRPVWVWWGGTLHTERHVGPARRILRKVICLWARHWISYGESSTEYLLSLRVNRQRILQIQNAVDEQRFAAQDEPEFDIHPRPVLLHVGQYIGRKGIELLLHAVAALQKDGHEFSLLLVGSGPDKQRLEGVAADLGIKNVHFHSSRRPEEMPRVYRSADVLIFPTLEDVWGLVANEAMLSGLAVLCSKYAGCADELFCRDNIFDPKDPADFAIKLQKAINGELPKSNLSCLKTTPQILGALVPALENSIRGTADRLNDAPVCR